MHFSEHIVRKIASLVAMMVTGLASLTCVAQSLTVDHSVLSISEGAVITVQGGVTITNSASIHNDGLLAVKGDWKNDGNGLDLNGEGTVTLSGENTVIGGSKSTIFQNLRIEEAVIDLQADISVAGAFRMDDALLITHDYKFILNNLDAAKFAWSNGGICRGDQACLIGAGTICSQGFPLSFLNPFAGIAVGLAVNAPLKRVALTRHLPSRNAHVVAATFRTDSRVGKCVPLHSAWLDRGPSHGAAAALRTRHMSLGRGEDPFGAGRDVSVAGVASANALNPQSVSNTMRDGEGLSPAITHSFFSIECNAIFI